MSAATLIIDAERCWRTGQMLAAIQASSGPVPVLFEGDLDAIERQLLDCGYMHVLDELAVDLAFWMAFGKEPQL